jgi:hypothetical protein
MSYQYQPPPDRKIVRTEQAGSNAFHWVMVVLTGGAWFLVWPLFRRKRVTRVRYR